MNLEEAGGTNLGFNAGYSLLPSCLEIVTTKAIFTATY